MDDIFHTAQLPLRAVTDGNMTLADTFHTMVEVVQSRQLPVKVNTPRFHLALSNACRGAEFRTRRLWLRNLVEAERMIANRVMWIITII